jgi:hypothetical protein
MAIIHFLHLFEKLQFSQREKCYPSKSFEKEKKDWML